MGNVMAYRHFKAVQQHSNLIPIIRLGLVENILIPSASPGKIPQQQLVFHAGLMLQRIKNNVPPPTCDPSPLNLTL